MITIADVEYVLGVIDANEEVANDTKEAFFALRSNDEKQAFLKGLTTVMKTKDGTKEGMNKGTAKTVKATKNASEYARQEKIDIGTVEPDKNGFVTVEEVRKAVEKRRK